MQCSACLIDNLSLTDGVAVPNADYIARPVYFFTFAAGSQFPIPFSQSIAIINDTVLEPPQAFRLEFAIESSVDDVYLETTSLFLRITDNDG